MGFWTRLRDLFRKETRVASGDPRRVLEVEKILAELRPALRADGGDLLLREVSASGEILLCAKGACEACGALALTLHGAVEPRLKQSLPWVTRVKVAGHPF